MRYPNCQHDTIASSSAWMHSEVSYSTFSEQPGNGWWLEMAVDIVLYSTTCAGTVKVRSDITRIKQLLEVKRVQYEEASDSSSVADFESLASPRAAACPPRCSSRVGARALQPRAGWASGCGAATRLPPPATPPPAAIGCRCCRSTCLRSLTGARRCWPATAA